MKLSNVSEEFAASGREELNLSPIINKHIAEEFVFVTL